MASGSPSEKQIGMTSRKPEKPRKYGQQPRPYLRIETKILRPTAMSKAEPLELRTSDVESVGVAGHVVPSVRFNMGIIYEDEYGKIGRLGIRKQEAIRPDDEESDARIRELVEEGNPLYEPPFYDELEGSLVSTYWYRRFID